MAKPVTEQRGDGRPALSKVHREWLHRRTATGWADLGMWRIVGRQRDPASAQAVYLAYHLNRCYEIRVVWDDYGGIKGIFPCVIEQVCCKIHIGALFFQCVNFWDKASGRGLDTRLGRLAPAVRDRRQASSLVTLPSRQAWLRAALRTVRTRFRCSAASALGLSVGRRAPWACFAPLRVRRRDAPSARLAWVAPVSQVYPPAGQW